MPALTTREAPPRTVVAAAVLSAAEGVALVIIAIVLVVMAAVGNPTSLFDALGGAALSLVAAACLLGMVPFLLQRRRWARSPVVVLQLLWLPVGYSLAFQAGRPAYGVPILLAAIAVLGLFAAPTARAAFEQ